MYRGRLNALDRHARDNDGEIDQYEYVMQRTGIKAMLSLLSYLEYRFDSGEHVVLTDDKSVGDCTEAVFRDRDAGLYGSITAGSEINITIAPWIAGGDKE
jgi:hypothetical protein